MGDRNSGYCVLDEQGEVMSEASVATTKKGLAHVFGETAKPSGIGSGNAFSLLEDIS